MVTDEPQPVPNMLVDDKSLSKVMVLSDNAKTLTEPRKTIEFMLTSISSTAAVEMSGNPETDPTIYTRSPDNQHTSLWHHCRGDRQHPAILPTNVLNCFTERWLKK
ncbi:hypothetical protein ACJMK2_014842 [Sinanodonta woodiana]|uniref:Uncharacterized protein n=1 Tax=Sinanodonta woodiana TaxID=1069815 RepID=A0ABD3V174_SINWO